MSSFILLLLAYLSTTYCIHETGALNPSSAVPFLHPNNSSVRVRFFLQNGNSSATKGPVPGIVELPLQVQATAVPEPKLEHVFVQDRTFSVDGRAAKPKPKADKPKAKADKPKAKADKPKAKADKPKAKADKPKAKADKPKAKADKPKAKADKPKPKADKSKAKSTPKPKVGAKAGGAVEGMQTKRKNITAVNRIIGGHNALPNEFPYHVAFAQDESTGCGASIISPSYVLTAAHCTAGFEAQYLTVTAGEHVLSRPEGHEQERYVAEVIDHEEYNPDSMHHDISILKLEKPFVFDKYVQPVELAGPKYEAKGLVTITGWGKSDVEDTAGTDRLQKIDLPIADHKTCAANYEEIEPNKPITDRQICAGYFDQDGKDACQGDSGGPAVVKEGDKFIQVGVTSFGIGCAIAGFPGIYTSVAKYWDWIDKIVKLDKSSPQKTKVKVSAREQAKKPPAKKPPAKKPPAKKPPAKKPPAKKTPAKKTPDKKPPTTKVPSPAKKKSDKKQATTKKPTPAKKSPDKKPQDKTKPPAAKKTGNILKEGRGAASNDTH